MLKSGDYEPRHRQNALLRKVEIPFGQRDIWLLCNLSAGFQCKRSAQTPSAKTPKDDEPPKDDVAFQDRRYVY
jgi:hypothetical protein